jgi:cell division protein FtsZ
MNQMMQFDLPKEQSSIIKVIGVGGGGSNAVNHMYKQGIKGVDFIVCNTDAQALDISPVPNKIQLGPSLTEGRGAGSLPEVGKNAAIENIDEIKTYLGTSTKMVFITAGMGGGTGTGAAPIIAAVAKELGILTVGIVTIPFAFEGKKRRAQAEEGLAELKKNVDTLLVISNDKLRVIYGNLKLVEAFGHADDVLTTAAKGIADIITTTLHINTDFADIQTVMKDSGVAIMGSASAAGENRAVKAVEHALCSPLLNDSDIKGARYVLLNITCGTEEITMDEFGEITDYIQEAAGQTAEIIQGYGVDETLGDKVSVTIIATGFNNKEDMGFSTIRKPEKVVLHLEDVKIAEPEKPVAKAPEVRNEMRAPEIKEETPKAEEPSIFMKNEDHNSDEENEIVTTLNLYSEPFVMKSFQSIDEEPEQEEAQRKNEPFLQAATSDDSFDEQLKRSKERILKLKELSLKIKSPSGVNDLEKEPAYRRRNIKLDSTPHSSENTVSRYTLSEDDDKKTEIKPNNSFLHDNVD